MLFSEPCKKIVKNVQLSNLKKKALFPSSSHVLTLEGNEGNTVEWDFHAILTVSRKLRELRFEGNSALSNPAGRAPQSAG